MFNAVLFLWQLTFICSVVCFFYGVLLKSRKLLWLSLVTFMPAAYYFSGAENFLKLVAAFPFILFFMIVLITKHHTRRKCDQTASKTKKP
ncbi:hypothetical protein D0466_02410 [Peribacillus glennii]|uniref:Uncharacterized protein n=1 Tax=Peribacillus glennii TaxID=2303991 RepID=A0A372LEY9_9BACI|nr:hypothetical protein D0466_02410 [Peribacillus glennii]